MVIRFDVARTEENRGDDAAGQKGGETGKRLEQVERHEGESPSASRPGV